MDIESVTIEIPEGCNIILGQTHFIKSIEDLYEIVATTVPQVKFGVAFTEASGPCLIRTEGNDQELVNVCVQNLQKMGAVGVVAASCRRGRLARARYACVGPAHMPRIAT